MDAQRKHIQAAQLQRLPTLLRVRPICFFLRGNPTTNSSQTKGQDPFYTFFPWPAIKHAAGTRKCLGWKVAGDLPNLWPHGPILGTRRLGPASNPLALQHADGFIGMVFLETNFKSQGVFYHFWRAQNPASHFFIQTHLLFPSTSTTVGTVTLYGKISDGLRFYHCRKWLPGVAF